MITGKSSRVLLCVMPASLRNGLFYSCTALGVPIVAAAEILTLVSAAGKGELGAWAAAEHGRDVLTAMAGFDVLGSGRAWKNGNMKPRRALWILKTFSMRYRTVSGY
jgi:hypothetical protein